MPLLTFISNVISAFITYWNDQCPTAKSVIASAILAFALLVSSCISGIYARKGEIIGKFLTSLPECIRVGILKRVAGPGTVIEATIYPNALWMIYRLNEDKIDEIQKYLPSGLTVIKHKLFDEDKEDDYYLCYNIYLSEFSGLEAIRLEINVAANNEQNQPCWVVLDVYTDMIRFDSVTPLYPANCKRKYFYAKPVDGSDTRKEIAIGIYMDNQEKKHDLFDFIVEIDSSDKALNADSVWVDACHVMYGGCEERRMVDEYGWSTEAQFDKTEHENYLNAVVKRSVNNLFTGIRGEFLTCFVIPNEQKYKLKIL